MRPISADLGSLLRSVLPDYTPISEAPREFRSEAERNLEKSSRYKAIDPSGNVFICANPHIIERGEYEDGRSFVYPNQKNFVGHISDLKNPKKGKAIGSPVLEEVDL